MRASSAFWILSGAMVLAVGGVGSGFSLGSADTSSVHAEVDTTYASSPYASTVRRKADVTSAMAAQAPVDRTLVDRFCVTCHNQRLKTGDVVLETVDFNQIAGNQELLEKVVHKLRAGQMPPAGARRPDKAAINTFASSLEQALDAAAAAAPNPGRFPVHRLNRVEYVNAIHDVLALDVDGATLLPADNSGLGFDNNADVLSVTPALMARYMSAATKISRLAIGDPAIRPVKQVYAASQFGRQDSRSSEDLVFGTHGGFAVRHAFPLDGEYTFNVRLQRNTVGNTIRGIDNEQEIELRLDRALAKRFKIGGEYRGSDFGILIAVPENEPDM